MKNVVTFIGPTRVDGNETDPLGGDHGESTEVKVDYNRVKVIQGQPIRNCKTNIRRPGQTQSEIV